jgi:hypothetical protein
MPALGDLHRAVQATLASKRIGQPVFVRCTVQGNDTPDAVVPRLAGITARVQEWVDQPIDRVYALGKVADGQISLTLRFRGGASAQISYARSQPRGDGLDLMILGNHGAVYHDAGSANLWDEPVGPAEGAADARVRAVIDRALQSGKPEPFAAGAKP